MADPFVAEIRIFPFNFPPKGWAFCNGQLMPLSQNTALFSLLGTTFGGDGKITFGLPNMQGNAPMHPNPTVYDPPAPHPAAPFLSAHELGESDGSATVILTLLEMPAHQHGAAVANQEGGYSATYLATSIARPVGATPFVPGPNPPLVPMALQALGPTGTNSPHNNMMPYLTLSFCIALQGVFPPRG